MRAFYLLLVVLFMEAIAIAPGVRAQSPAPKAEEEDPRIPITFTLAQSGYVTLVVEDAEGVRVRNLISEVQYPAGTHTVMWDGMDDRERDKAAAQAAIFHIPGKMVAPGKYTVRGLSHPQIDIVYELTPYTAGNPPWRTEDGGSQWLTNHSSPSDVIFLPAGKAPERDGKPTSKGAQLLICSRVAEGGSGIAWVDSDGKKLWGQHWLGGVWTAASHMAVDRGDKPVPGVYAYAAASWPGDKYNDNRSELRLHKFMEPGHTRAAPKDKRFGSGEDRPVLEPTYTIPTPAGIPDKIDDKERKKLMAELTGLAVRNGIIACSFAKLNHILWVDANTSKELGTSNIAAPGGLAFDSKADLYVLSEKKLLRYKVDLSKPTAIAEPAVLVSDLEDPQNVTVADDGTIYVSDWGTSHQIKVFAADGKPLKQIGVAGVPRSGPYDPNHMNKPAGMALDDRGRIWVTENTHIPKRVSIWNLSDGKLADAFYGPMRYGGSGSLSPLDKTRFFYDDDHGGTLEFKLDYATGKSTPVAIPYLVTEDASGIKGRYVGGPPSYPLVNGKYLYLTNAHSQSTSGRRSSTVWRMDPDGMARLVAAAGSVLDSSSDIMPAFTEPDMAAKLATIAKADPAKPGATAPEKRNIFFVWSDANGDQKLQPDEVQFLDPAEYPDPAKKGPASLGNVNVTDDLAFTISHVGNVVLQLSPTSISDNGVPKYDMAQRKVLAKDINRPASTGGGQVLPAKDGWLITTTPVKPFDAAGLGGVRDGKPMWSYPSLWPGLHASHIAPLPKDAGQLIGTTRVIGNVIDALPGSDAGQLWAINANKGTIYVFTVDGLFVTRLFQDSRTASWNAPEAKRGMTVNHLSLHEECFGPIWTRTTDGEVYLQGGGCGNICRLVNLDKIKRLDDQSLTLTAAQLEKAQHAAVLAEARRQEEAAANAKPLQAAARTQPMVIDGKLDDWLNISWVNIDKRSQSVGNWGKRDLTTRAAAAVWDDKLVLTWQTGDKDLLRSSGESMNNLFKCGGALDVLIGTSADANPSRRKPVAGDQRLLITLVKDKQGEKDKEKIAAVLYEPVAAEKKGAGAEFGSPLRTIKFDRVEVVSDQIQLASTSEKDLKADKDGKIVITTYEVAIPLGLLNLKPEPGKSYKFDIGVLRGNGQETLQRSYWTNKASGLVSDIPSEAELIPALWGTIQFGAP